MGQISDSALYPFATQVVAGDSLIFNKASDSAQHLVEFSALVTSIAALLSTRLTARQVAANVTLDDTYEMVVGASGSAITVTLPLAASFPGKQYNITNQGAGVVTVQRTGADNIDNVTAVALAQWASTVLVSDGVSHWSQF